MDSSVGLNLLALDREIHEVDLALKQPHNKRYESFSARPTAFRFSQPRLQFARARSVHVGPFQLGILEAVRVDRGGVRIGVWRV